MGEVEYIDNCLSREFIELADEKLGNSFYILSAERSRWDGRYYIDIEKVVDIESFDVPQYERGEFVLYKNGNIKISIIDHDGGATYNLTVAENFDPERLKKWLTSLSTKEDIAEYEEFLSYFHNTTFEKAGIESTLDLFYNFDIL